MCLDWNPPIYAFHILGMTGTHHYAQHSWLRWDLMNFFCPGCSWIVILLISVSRVARVIGMSHHARPC
jgi:hypothetical protein